MISRRAVLATMGALVADVPVVWGQASMGIGPKELPSYFPYKVFGITGREQMQTLDSGPSFGDDASPDGAIAYFHTVGTVPPTHTKGAIERPQNIGVFGLEKESALKHITTASGGVLSLTQFMAELRKAVSKTWRATVYIYFHGINTSHPDALYRAYQLLHDVDPNAVLILVSWPTRLSQSLDPRAYTAAINEIPKVIPYVRDLLRLLVNADFVKSIKLIGFSLGAEAALRGTAELALPGQGIDLRKIKALALVSADVGVRDFGLYLPKLIDIGVEIVNYGSESDGWLRVSESIRKERRIGQGGDKIFKHSYITSVDLDRVETGHNLFQVHEVIDDLGDWLADGLAPWEGSRGRRWQPLYDSDNRRFLRQR